MLLPKLVWVDADFLLEVAPWNELPLWLPSTHAAMMTRDSSAAIDRGLTFRPFAETVKGTAAWLKSGEPVPEKDSGVAAPPLLSHDRERELLSAWSALG